MARSKDKPFNQALDLIIKGLEKDFGTGVVMDMQSGVQPVIPTCSWGSLAIDQASGGAPKGRIIEIYGPESSGKTTITLGLIAAAQKNPDWVSEGRRAVFIDAENALSLPYAQALGVDTDDLILCQPSSGEEGLQVAERLIRSGKVSVCVVDSVAALVPKAEIDGEIGDSHVGLQARMMSQALRILSPICSKTGTILVFINQLRMKIGVMFGNPEVTSGGNALKFYASQRLDVRRSTSKANMKMDSSGDAVSCPTKITIVKNKIFPPFRTAEVEMVFGKGIDKVQEVFSLALIHGLLEDQGRGRYYYNGESIAHGKANALSFLEQNPEIYSSIREALADLLLNK